MDLHSTIEILEKSFGSGLMSLLSEQGREQIVQYVSAVSVGLFKTGINQVVSISSLNYASLVAQISIVNQMQYQWRDVKIRAILEWEVKSTTWLKGSLSFCGNQTFWQKGHTIDDSMVIYQLTEYAFFPYRKTVIIWDFWKYYELKSKQTSKKTEI